MRTPPLALVAITLTDPATAQPVCGSPREANALRDIARAQERQADELQRLRQIDRIKTGGWIASSALPRP